MSATTLNPPSVLARAALAAKALREAAGAAHDHRMPALCAALHRAANDAEEAIAKVRRDSSDKPPGWIEPQDRMRRATYILTRRRADAAPGHESDRPDERVCFAWNGNGAWIPGWRDGIQRRQPMLVCLHSNSGWRLEGGAP